MYSMKKNIRFVPLLALLLVSLPSAAADAECAKPAATQVVKCFSFDLAMPDSPGLIIVGLGTDKVVRPTTPRKLGAALVDAIGEDGKPRRGFALDLAPYKYLKPGMTHQQYIDSPILRRPLWNTQFSAGIGKGTDADDKSLRIGYGFSSVLWRTKASDPLLNTTYQECLDARLAGMNSRGAMPTIGSKTGSDAALAQCYAEFAEQSWHSTALTVGFAGSRVSDDGKWSNAKGSATGVWATFSYAFDNVPVAVLSKNSELLLSWRKMTDERVADPADKGSFLDQDSRATLVMFRMHGERRNVHLEHSWQHEERPAETTRTRRMAVGLEWKLVENTWLVIAFGKQRSHSSTNGDSFVQTGLKFGALDKPTFAN